MKYLMTGNEGVARGLYAAGAIYCSASPGTPSTEILEEVAQYKDVLVAEWANNEKVALESAIGRRSGLSLVSKRTGQPLLCQVCQDPDAGAGQLTGSQRLHC